MPELRICGAAALLLFTACSDGGTKTAPMPTPTPLATLGVTPQPDPTPTPSPNGAGQPFVAAQCPAEIAFGEVDALGLAMERAGLTPEAFGYGDGDYDATEYRPILFDRFMLSDFRPYHDDARRTHCFGRLVSEIADHALDSRSPLATLVARAAERIDRGFGWERLPRPRLDDHGLSSLASAISALHVRLGEAALSDARLTAMAQEAEAIPKDLQLALVPLVLAVAEAAAKVNEALGDVPEGDVAGYFNNGPGILFPNEAGQVVNFTLPAVEAFIDGADWQPKLYEAAWILAGAVDAARARLQPFVGTTGFSFEAETPIGWIVVRDGAVTQALPEDAVAGGDIALWVDTGGNDEYRIPAGANRGRQNPVSLVLDLAGNDFYGYPEVPHALDGDRMPSDVFGRYTPRGEPNVDNGPISLSETSRQGAGRLGVGMLADLGAGSDSYRSLRMSQGFGAFGAGVLFDDGGNDRYEAEAGAQGSAMIGLGLLVDAAGDDDYRAYQYAQGFGWVRGGGWLVDGGGNDVYFSDIGDPEEGGDPLYLSAQRPGTGNSSFTQGAGFGLRADNARRWWSGGLGVLRDRAGDDRYTTSVFGQGVGYWFGTGVLADGGGSDQYDGIWYVQGAGAHYATGVLLDSGEGNDTHNERGGTVGVALGSGHDYSVGVLVAGGGSDSYKGGGLGIGTGNCNGVGLFVDLGGNDRYDSTSTESIGKARLSGECNSPDRARRNAITAALFIDIGGVDEYLRPEGAEPVLADDSEWVQTEAGDDAEAFSEHGAGIDISNAASSVHP